MNDSQRILQLDLSDRARLYRLYMSFVKGGGLFVPTDDRYALGDEVFVMVRLPDTAEAKSVSGKVVWITPRGAASPHQQGVGIQIGNLDRGELHHRIEALLAGAFAAGRPTQTL
ncbi:MAG: PilZ domain-containing protein [Gammaproteobacteria bacterium]